MRVIQLGFILFLAMSGVGVSAADCNCDTQMRALDERTEASLRELRRKIALLEDDMRAQTFHNIMLTQQICLLAREVSKSRESAALKGIENDMCLSAPERK
jgi:hypothetical protein